MGDITEHRGPDDHGGYHDQHVAIGMRRLSIIDLGGGHQPISNADDTLWLVCNGEIYNFLSLRQQLQARGHVFKTQSDSEVVLHAYAEYGMDFIEHIDGMFNFALWDKPQRKLIIGRDRLGIKPLYYYQDEQRLIFATEAKAILQVPGVETAICPEAIEPYLNLGYVPAPLSLFKGIRKLPVATLMCIQDGQVSSREYWQAPTEVDQKPTEDEWVEQVNERLQAAVAEQMVSDVPVGAFLSGGIDSSAVVALMSQQSNQPVNTYSIGFGGDQASEFYNELPFAKRVAELYKTNHQEIIVKPDVVTLLPKLLWHMDEPMADAAFITTYLVSEFASQSVTVILSGVGGDELFGGYRRYQGEYYSQMYRKIPAPIRKNVLQKVAQHMPADRHSQLLNYSRLARSFILSAELPFAERYGAYMSVFDESLMSDLLLKRQTDRHDALAEAFAQAKSDDVLNQFFQVDARSQLPDDLLLLTDKMTMATSLECRVPLLDTQLVEMACRMPGQYKIKGRELKSILKKALAKELPDDILYRKKRGFGAPMGAWIKDELAPLLRGVLSQDTIEQRGLFRWEGVAATMAAHESNKADHTDHLLALMNLEIWSRLYLDGRSPDDVATELKSYLQ